MSASSQTSRGHDLIVIGGGPGGYTAAIRGAQLGWEVALVESEPQLGGICLNWGCIPTKSLLKQAELFRLMQRAGEFGLKASHVGFDWDKLIARSREVSLRMAGGVAQLMKKNRINVFSGWGRLTPDRQVEVATERNSEGGSILASEHILLATGSRPRSLPGIDIDGEIVISSKQAMVLPRRPKSIVIIGAGASGIEFAYFFNAFGAHVTLLEADSQILPGEDEDVAAVLVKSLRGQGIEVKTGVRVRGVKKVAAKVKRASVIYSEGGSEHSATGEIVLMAVGVEANVEDLGFAALGLATRKGVLPVNGRFETRVRGVYAIGDLIGGPQLAHSAAAEAVAAVGLMAGEGEQEVDAMQIPRLVYCQPQVASVGLTEREARAQSLEVKVGKFPFIASGKAWATGETEGFAKLIFGTRYGELLGAAAIGSEATELIAEAGLALMQEVTYEELLATVHAHPTLSEAWPEAAGAAFGMALNI
ncbi:MAG: dihydrolipoyl dehydrogenase [Candidatus Latescibacterota bacterium]|nr:dihydrolipoyl dehydrogenase [Candidatus Latescibacterota bacterium]